MIPERIIEEITHRISQSVNRVLVDRDEGRIGTEPGLTGRLLAHLERDLDDNDLQYRTRNIRLKARTLRDRGPNAPENKYGADLAAILDVDIEDHKINKGILAQSKSIPDSKMQGTYSLDASMLDSEPNPPNPGALKRPTIDFEVNGIITFTFSPQEYRRLEAQCIKMLHITPDSFVFLYCVEDIYVIPANTVAAGNSHAGFHQFHCKNFKLFFSDFLRSFLGDQHIRGTSDADLQELSRVNNIDNILQLRITDETAGR